MLDYDNIMPACRVLIVVLIMFASLTVYNMNTLHNMVKKQMAVSSRWGAEQNVTQSGEGQPKFWLSERCVRRTSGNACEKGVGKWSILRGGNHLLHFLSFLHHGRPYMEISFAVLGRSRARIE